MTINTKTRFKNQSSLLNMALQPNIMVIGCGGTGSMSALILAKMGLQNITLIDRDDVEDHNVASQFYKESQLGVSKVEALKDNIKEFTGVDCNIVDTRWTPAEADKFDNDFEPNIVLLAMDNMEVRKQVVDHYKNDIQVTLLEVRMGGNDNYIYTFNPYVSYFEWLGTWFPDSEAEPTICTEKAICYNTCDIAGKVGRIVSDIIMNRPVPFATSNLPLGTFTIE